MIALRSIGRVTVAAIALLAAISPAIPANANEVSMDCGYGTIGYGGTYVVEETAYTTTWDCSYTYLSGTYYVGGVGHTYGGSYKLGGWNVWIEGSSAASTHRMCNYDWTICSAWKGTSSSQ